MNPISIAIPIASFDLLSFAANPIFSSALGIFGPVIMGVVTYFQTKQAHAFEMEKSRLEMDRMKLQGDLDQAKLAGILMNERERQAGQGFTASQVAESSLTSRNTSKWVSNLRESSRPLLTWFYQIVLVIITTLILTDVINKQLDNPIVQYVVVMAVNTASMTVSWWFGQRQMEKLDWGNRLGRATVSGSGNASVPAIKP